MADKLRSNWKLDDLLQHLSAYRYYDVGGLLECRLGGINPTRTAYVYLYGEDPNLIHYDLEDESAQTDEWDHAVERGSVSSIDDLKAVLRRWLDVASGA